MSIINRDKKTFSSGLPLILKYDGEVILDVERGCRMLTTYDLDELEFFVKRSKDFIKNNNWTDADIEELNKKWKYEIIEELDKKYRK